MREDYAEHNARERKRGDEGFRKWSWRLTDEVVEAVWPGLRKELKADSASAFADADAFYDGLPE